MCYSLTFFRRRTSTAAERFLATEVSCRAGVVEVLAPESTVEPAASVVSVEAPG
jgi:hypothetical protein